MFASVIFCIIQQRLAALFSFHLLHPLEIAFQQRFFRYKFRHPVLFQIQLRGPCEHHPVLKLVLAQEAVIIHSHFIENPPSDRFPAPEPLRPLLPDNYKSSGLSPRWGKAGRG